MWSIWVYHKVDKIPEKGVFMKKLLLSILALCALSMVSTQISAKAAEKTEKATNGTTTYRCGHCKAHLEHQHSKCQTHGCKGATVICERPVTVVEEERRACETTCTYRCPEGTEQRGEGEHTKCIRRTVKEHCEPAIKDTVIDCKQACPAGTTMKPGSERDHAHPKNHDKAEKTARRAKNTVTREM